jgi:ribosomal protein L16/L10AE
MVRHHIPQNLKWKKYNRQFFLKTGFHYKLARIDSIFGCGLIALEYGSLSATSIETCMLLLNKSNKFKRKLDKKSRGKLLAKTKQKQKEKVKLKKEGKGTAKKAKLKPAFRNRFLRRRRIPLIIPKVSIRTPDKAYSGAILNIKDKNFSQTKKIFIKDRQKKTTKTKMPRKNKDLRRLSTAYKMHLNFKLSERKLIIHNKLRLRKIYQPQQISKTVYPRAPYTSKPITARMGRGKGSIKKWLFFVRPGRILFKLNFVLDLKKAYNVMRRLQYKLPILTKIILKNTKNEFLARNS